MSKITRTLASGVEGVRLATKRDEDEIFALLVMLHGENAPFSLNREKVRAGIRVATECKGGMIGVIDHGDRVVALIALVIATDWYSDDCYLYERSTFVHPDYRKSDYAKRLVEFGKWASDWFTARGTPMPFFCGVTSTNRTAAKIKLYGRQMLCVGANFLYGKAPRVAADRMLQSAADAVMNKNNRVQPAVAQVLKLNAAQESAHV